MKTLLDDNDRKKIVDSDINNGFILIKESVSFPIISQTKPFLYQVGNDTGKSLHSLLTTTLDFANPYDLPQEYRKLYFLNDEFLTRLYSYITLQDGYDGSRVIKIIENAHFPEFHKHFSLACNEGKKKISLSDSIDPKFRNCLALVEIASYRKILVEYKDDFGNTEKGSELLNKILDQSNSLGRQI